MSGTLDFVPEYSVVEWRISDLRDRLDIIIELPCRIGLRGIVYGVFDEGNNFEIKVDNDKDLLGPCITFRIWVKVHTKENGEFHMNRPKRFQYFKIFDSNKYSPEDKIKKEYNFTSISVLS